MDFRVIKDAVTQQFARMAKHDLFLMDVEGDTLWEVYLASFPEGTNPIFRKRTEHDCSCCRHFVKTIGGAVAVVDGQLTSVWDVEVADPGYQAVTDALSRLVKSRPIRNQFLHHEDHVGTDLSHEEGEASVIAWSHFYVKIPVARNTGRNYYCEKARIPTILSQSRSAHDVFMRGLVEIKIEAVDAVIDLIAENSLYRGAEHEGTLRRFRALKARFDELPRESQDHFAWASLSSTAGAVSGVRNTAIGTLLTDLSEGMELEDGVRRFEVMMAPTNYRRPTALVTQKMVDAAREAVEKLGLRNALHRRHARLSDVSVNNVLFADREARSVMRDDVFGEVKTRRLVPRRVEAPTIGIEEFIASVVPRVSSMEVLFEGDHAANLVSLIAPADPRGVGLFKWDNDFSWSYRGDLADSIRERVKKAGGNVTGDLCCRLAWYNYDDLDLHMREVKNRYEIYYGNRHHQSPSGGRLDVDMNAGSGTTREPVENIFYADRNQMREGDYALFVRQFQKRESQDVGFEVEIDVLGTVTRYVHEGAVPQGDTVPVATLRYSRTGGIEVVESILPATSTSASGTVWGLQTQQFYRVSALLLSPNYWDEQRGFGNKHYFFVLDGCARDDPARGFYNEFLRPDLDQHRKVLEVVGSKLKVEPAADQLSGLGFSSTQRAEVAVKVTGEITRTFKVTF